MREFGKSGVERNVNLTEKQARAVETQTKNVLVSAAAGSGKTSVLAKRVVRIIENGGDVRSMLVMTFTNAAAAEMRQRIARELREEGARGGGRRLYDQAEFVAAADISTFHSFCGKVVRRNYALLGLSPGVRIMDEGEMNRIKSASARELFDDLYEAEDAGFLQLLKRYTRRGDDRTLADYLFRIYDYLMSKPDPFGWARWSEEKNNPDYIAWLGRQHDESIAEGLSRAEAWIAAAAAVSGSVEEKQFAQDMICIALLKEMRQCVRTEGAQAFFARYGGAKIPNVVKGLHESCKARIQKMYGEARKLLKEALLAAAEPFAERVQEELSHTQQDVRAMIRLVRAFHERYAGNKTDANVLDYSDMEHFALRALQDEDVRALYAATYQYIFVDEYQDTNPVQEEIVRAVSCEGSLFMVGDIKQSIYKFRLADPFIFREKAREFRREAEGGELILMNDNFRSKKGVIDAVNGIMERVMCERLGEVCYDDGERLCGSADGGGARILLCGEKVEDGKDRGKHAVQAEMIAAEIERELSGTVADKKTGQPRPVSCGDIAVLFRSRGELIYHLKSELDKRGIPCAVDVEQAKDLKEIELFVNVLRLVDNPQQDVPLLSVMRSFIGGMDEQDFAQIRVADGPAKEPFYRSAERYAQRDDPLAGKLRFLYARLGFLRTCAVSLSIPEFLARMAQEFDFETYLACTPGGEMKQAVFSQFLAMAAELGRQENSLYLLLRALREIKKKDGAYLKAAVRTGSADCVHITTIHGSKGLEYPIVYVAGLERTLTVQDFKNRMLIHADFGLVAQYIDEEKLLRRPTAELELAKRQIRREYLSEELRVLYVAMTRARERLVLAGSVGDMERARERWQLMRDMGNYEDAKSMLDWIMAANADDVIPVEAIDGKREEDERGLPDVSEEIERLRGLGAQAELLSAGPYDAVPAKVSVSAVKQAKSIRHFLTPVLPDEDEEITGARLGTLVHSMMERAVFSAAGIEEAARDMLARKLLTRQEYEAVMSHQDWIRGFLETPLYARIEKAGKVLREQPFNLEVEADSIGYEGTGKMLVQGILDLAFLEDAWVLVDYKTDRVTEKTVDETAQGYAVQLELYARALHEITGIPVKEKYLYFLRLQKCMEL